MRRVITFMANRRYRAFGLSLALGLGSVFFGLASQTVHAADYSNDIMYGGFSSPHDFIQTVRSNNSGNGHHDLTAVYQAYGLEPAEYDRFVSSAQPGLAYKDNTLRVNGQVVARNVVSIGRNAAEQGPGYFTQVIDGNKYYGNTNDKAFASGPLPVTVLFDGHHNVEFAVINSCGNPVGAPSYSCDMLHATAVPGQPGTYTFYTDAAADSTAHITKVVYDFGDGSRPDTETKPNLSVTHTYSHSGNFTARVKVYISLPGQPDFAITSANCAKQITVNLPFYQCLQLDANTINGNKYQYRFVVTAKIGNGAVLKGGDFNFGDHKTGSAGTNGNRVTIDHTYSKAGNYTVKATLRVKLPSGEVIAVGSPDCSKQIHVAIPFYSCTGLTADLLDTDTHQYRFTATASFGQGAVLKSGDFAFGDGHSKQNVKANVNGGSGFVTTDYAYANASQTYNAVATLHFSVGSSVKSVQCTVSIPPNQSGTPECQPGIPQGSALCTPCTPSQTQPSSSGCTLPNTGAGDVIGISGAVAVLGFFFYRQFISRRHALAEVGVHHAHHHVADDEEDDDLVKQIVVSHPHHHQRHRQPLHHPTYHRPHRFRPEKKHHQDEE